MFVFLVKKVYNIKQINDKQYPSFIKGGASMHLKAIKQIKNYTKYLNSAYCLTTVVENWIVLTKMEKMTQNCLKKQKIWYNF